MGLGIGVVQSCEMLKGSSSTFVLPRFGRANTESFACAGAIEEVQLKNGFSGVLRCSFPLQVLN